MIEASCSALKALLFPLLDTMLPAFHRVITNLRSEPLRVTVAALSLMGVIVLAIIATKLPSQWSHDALASSRNRYARTLVRAGAEIREIATDRLQRQFNDCGVAIVREAVRTYTASSTPSWTEVASTIRLTSAGASLNDLASVLASFQIKSHRLDRRISGAIAFPAVALTSARHFVLIRRVDSGYVEFFDPLVGEVRIPETEFRNLWNGVGIELEMGIDPSPNWGHRE